MPEETNAPDPKVSIAVDKEKYVEQRSPAGTKSYSNGDTVSQVLQGMNSDEINQIADKLFPDNDFRERYKERNVGMQRMIVGNRIRGWVAKRDKENEALVAEDKKPKASGIDALDKAASPLQKAAAQRSAAAQREKDAKKQAAGVKRAEKEKAA